MIKHDWTIEQIDDMDSHFLLEVLEVEDFEKEESEEKVYLSQIWR